MNAGAARQQSARPSSSAVCPWSSPINNAMASFCDSFGAANSHRGACCYATGSPADNILHPCGSSWCGSHSTVDLHLLAADNFFLQKKLQARNSSGANSSLVVEHSLTPMSSEGNIGAVVLLRQPAPACSTSATTRQLGSMVHDAGEWEQYVMDHTKGCLQYTGDSMSSLLSTWTSTLGRYNTPQISCSGGSSRAHDHVREGTMIRELSDSIGGDNNLGVPCLQQGASISRHEPAGGHHMEKLLHHGPSSWRSPDPRGDLTADPSRIGGLALQAAGVDLATSHCLVRGLSSDLTAFAEQTSSFGSGGEYPTQAQQPVSSLLTDSPGESRSRSPGEAGHLQAAHESSSHGNLSRTSSTVGVKIEAGVSLTMANTVVAQQHSQAAGVTQVCAISDDESKELCGTGSPLPTSLEAFEGARESSTADEAVAARENSDPGILSRSNTTSRGATITSIAVPEKKRKNVLTPDDRDHHGSNLCQESTILQEETDGTKPKRIKPGNGAAPRKTSQPEDEVQQRSPRKQLAAEAGIICNDNSDNDDSSQGMSKENLTHPARKLQQEQPHVDLSKQDYIHVRARRGQATDSHSLAERVRREKINERMKYLQDLVPGCSKVTGMAVMLDEIINYVQFLQLQVENLSMKLASVDHSSLFSSPNCYVNLQQQQATVASFHQGVFGACTLESRHDSLNANFERGSSDAVSTTTEFLQGSSCISSVDAAAVAIDQNRIIQRSTSSLSDGSDLQSIVQMGILQCGQTTSMILQGLNCHVPVGHMKVVL